ncbi:MAG: ORF6N domain-containing protein [Candidatus Omnitrophica bacterium]|nr:ORF6N domain-containing protein [Candidatus Omnitrophota bacterium]
MKEIAQQEFVDRRILVIRGHRVMLSTHLAELYDIKPKVLMQAVKRSIELFPEDFMLQLTWEEAEASRSQFVTSSLVSQNALPGKGHDYEKAFTAATY